MAMGYSLRPCDWHSFPLHFAVEVEQAVLVKKISRRKLFGVLVFRYMEAVQISSRFTGRCASAEIDLDKNCL